MTGSTDRTRLDGFVKSATALLAGASVQGVIFPSGYDEVDALLKSRMNGATGS